MSWACVKCGREATIYRLRPTASDAYLWGYCLGCRTERLHGQGEAEKETGMRLAETAEAIAGTWVEEADKAIGQLAAEGVEFTAETLAERVGRPSHPNAMGARIHAAAAKGIIEKVGVVKAKRRERHANEMRVWRGRTT